MHSLKIKVYSWRNLFVISTLFLEAKELTDKAQTEVSVDRNKPHGQIQIRQPNGQQLIGEFNETHTIEDVRSYIVA